MPRCRRELGRERASHNPMIRTSSVAATKSSNLRSDEPIGLCLTLDDARVVLEYWQGEGQRLGFSFFRACEGVVRAGQATVVRVGARTVTLDAGDRRFAVAIENACIEFTQVGLCRCDFRTVYAEGLSVSLVNDDWLFLFQEMHGHARYSRYRLEAAIGSLATRGVRGGRRPQAPPCSRALWGTKAGHHCKGTEKSRRPAT